MKTQLLATSLITAISVLSVSLKAAPVSSSGAAGARVVPPTVSPSPAAPGMPQQPGISPTAVTAPINGTSTISTNPIAANPTNAMPSTNQFATTNGVQENNGLAGTPNQANGNFVLRDQAVTPSDKVLLSTLTQGIASQIGVTSPAATPVHFFINNGAVTLVGTVPTADESQRILARVQQTPGVLSVFNDLHVGTPSTVVQPRDAVGQTVTDHAFSPADQALLTTVEQQAAQQLGITGASASQMSVHFSIQNGVVGAMGQLSSAQEKAALIAALQRTPGVVRVVDDISLTGPATMPTPAAANPATGPLAPTSRDGQTNNFMLNTTNSSGF
jgi:BON domain